VTYASKYGSAREIAEKIGEVLRQASLQVGVLPVKDVHRFAPYRAVILGCAVYIGNWLNEAGELVKANEKDLAERLLWLFSSGPTGNGNPVDWLDGWRIPADRQPMIDRLQPRDVAVFHGDNNQDKVNLIEKWTIKSLVKNPFGDFRVWEPITAWTTSIIDALKEAERSPLSSHLEIQVNPKHERETLKRYR
jgi:menaquinone-dependent protoporphyrinogen oxidase